MRVCACLLTHEVKAGLCMCNSIIVWHVADMGPVDGRLYVGERAP